MTFPIAHPLQGNGNPELVADIFQAITIALVTIVGLLTVALSF